MSNRDLSIEEFIQSYSNSPIPVLEELERYTHQKVLNSRMISGQIQGQFLSWFSNILKPSRILEIGTYTGYSAICLAGGLAPGGMVHTIEVNDELAPISTGFFRKAGLSNQIILHTGDALTIVPELEECFDLAFIDGEKSEYPRYLDAILPKMKKGAYLIADNIFWNGKVLKEKPPADPSTRGILDFCRLVKEDPDLESLILPIRDGLMLIRV